MSNLEKKIASVASSCPSRCAEVRGGCRGRGRGQARLGIGLLLFLVTKLQCLYPSQVVCVFPVVRTNPDTMPL